MNILRLEYQELTDEHQQPIFCHEDPCNRVLGKDKKTEHKYIGKGPEILNTNP